MKKLPYKSMVTTVTCLLVIAMSDFAEARPGHGPVCAACHSTLGGALNVLPSDLLQIPAGGSQTVTFEYTDIPSGETALALTGLTDPLLGASFGAGWTDFVVLGYIAPDEPFVSAPAPKSYILELSIDAGATLGDYFIAGQMAGGPGSKWSSTFDFMVSVIPEPSGDFNGDGFVDGEDFLFWQLDPSVGPLSAWEANYGMVAPLSATSAAIPEPTTCALALAAFCLVMNRRRSF